MEATITTSSELNERWPTRGGDWVADRLIPRDCPTVWASPAEVPTVLQQRGCSLLSSADVEQYRRDGFIVVRNVFSPTETDAIRRAAHLMRSSLVESGAGGDRVVYEPSKSDSNSNKVELVRSIFDVHRVQSWKTTQSPRQELDRGGEVFEALACEQRVVSVAASLLNDDVYLHQSRINFQPPFKGTGFTWHSDCETWISEDGMGAPRCLSASILLCDNNTNGPLMLMPGSQNTFVGCKGATPKTAAWKDSLRKPLYFGTPSQASLTTLARAHGIVQATAPKGSVIFFDSNVIHGSGSNITPFGRENVFCAFNSCANKIGDVVWSGQGRPEYLACRDAAYRGVAVKPRIGLEEVLQPFVTQAKNKL